MGIKNVTLVIYIDTWWVSQDERVLYNGVITWVNAT